MISPGAVYRHYKGGMYKVIFAGTIHGTEGASDGVPVDRVIYESLNDSADYPKGTVWRRTFGKFEEWVTVDGVEVPRFERMRSDKPALTTPDIRYATEDDLDTIEQIAQEMNDMHEAGDPELQSMIFVPRDQQDLRTSFAHSMDADDEFVIVSGQSGNTDGFAICDVQHRDGSDNLVAKATVVHISFIAVRADARSQGHGERLMRAIKEIAVAKDASRVNLNVWSFNSRAQAFYERCGFKTRRSEMVARTEWLFSGTSRPPASE
jgi:diamine N-acetyltransferase